MVEVWVERTRLVRVSASRFPVQAIKNKIRVNSYLLFYLVRVERIELSSQVWKTCILTTVLYPLVNGVGYRDRTDDLLDHNQTL